MELDQILASFGPLVAKVDPDDLAAILKNVASITQAMEGEVPEAMTAAKRLIQRLEELAEIVPGLQADVPALTRDLRRVTKSVQATIGKADALLDQMSGLSTEADTALDDVPAVVASAKDDLARALERSDELVQKLEAVADRLEGFDEETVRHLLREEGVLVRLKPLSQGEKKGPPRPGAP